MSNAKKARLVYLDPDEVGVHDNVRHDLGDLTGLTNSINELGVLIPVTVIKSDGEFAHEVVEGQRRRAAASKAKAVLPALVTESVDEALRIGRQLAENLNRKPLTAKEEADGYEQMALLGMSNTAIARAVGVSRKHVSDSRKVAASAVASAVAERHDLTLDQLLVLAEFEDDREAVKALTVTARKEPAKFPHLASRLRQDRERAEQEALLVEALTAEGVAILDRASDEPNAVSLRDLTDSDDGTPIKPEAHTECPGRAAVLDDFEADGVRWYCVDPSAHGHRNRHSASGRPKPTPMSEEAKAERQEVRENNRDWRAAEPVRREYVQALVARKKAPNGTLRFVAEAIAADPGRLRDVDDALLAELVGVEGQVGHGRVGSRLAAEAADSRLPLVLLAHVAAACERRMDVYVWRHPRDHAEVARYLAFLGSTGYGLSDIEQFVVDEVMGDGDAKTSDEQLNEVEDEAA